MRCEIVVEEPVMNVVPRRPAVLVACLLIGLRMAAFAGQAPASAPLAGAAITAWKGNVQLQLPGQAASAPLRHQTLPAGTLLDTGKGRLVLQLEDGSQVLVAPHTRLILEQPAIGNWQYLQLLLGRIVAKVTKRTVGAPSFQLGTPTAVISVRGTQFEVEVNRHNVTEVDVFEGLVEVAGAGNRGPSMLLQPGFSTRVGPDFMPESPRPTDDIRPEVERPRQESEWEWRDHEFERERTEREPTEPAESSQPEVEKPD
ncbi:MAG: FecR domain-containing protein [Chlamydiota bacterium]